MKINMEVNGSDGIERRKMKKKTNEEEREVSERRGVEGEGRRTNEKMFKICQL